MARRLPPLTALRAFEAVARRLSITAAAEELGVTPGAVSQSVKALEEYYGKALFARTPRGLVLTDAAAAALPALIEGFDRLLEGSKRMAGPDRGGRLTVSVPPSFAAKWLGPRLPEFFAQHPDLDVQIDASMGLANFDEGVDIAIRFGAGRWHGLETQRLLREEVTPVCVPAMAGQILAPDDLARFTLIHDEGAATDESCPDWTMWLRAAGAAHIDASRGPRFNQSSLAIDAALAGQGVALAKRTLAQVDLDAGRLAAPFAVRTPIDFAYWLAYPPGRVRSRPAKAFLTWVKDVAERYEQDVKANASYTSSTL